MPKGTEHKNIWVGENGWVEVEVGDETTMLSIHSDTDSKWANMGEVYLTPEQLDEVIALLEWAKLEVS